MTDQERKEAERLADNFTLRNEDAIDANYLRQTILKIYEVACWAKHAEIAKLKKENAQLRQDLININRSLNS